MSIRREGNKFVKFLNFIRFLKFGHELYSLAVHFNAPLFWYGGRVIHLLEKSIEWRVGKDFVHSVFGLVHCGGK